MSPLPVVHRLAKRDSVWLCYLLFLGFGAYRSTKPNNQSLTHVLATLYPPLDPAVV
jgi:hypothetical protein